MYILIDPISKEIRYVGQTSLSLKRRLYFHFYDNRKSYKKEWLNSLSKKGLKPIVELVDAFKTQEEVNLAEIKLIKHYRNNSSCLTNLCDGGNVTTGYKFTEEQKNKMKGRKPHNLGIPPSEETKKEISNSLKEYLKINKNGFKNKKHSDKTKKTIKEKNSKKIALIDDFGNIIKTWNSIKSAANDLDLKESSISKVCTGKRNSLFNKKFILC